MLQPISFYMAGAARHATCTATHEVGLRVLVFSASTSDAQSLVRQNSNTPAPAPFVLSARRVLYTRQTLFHSFRTHVPAFRFCVVFFFLLLLMFSPMTNIGRSYVRAVRRCDARGVALGS